MHHIDNIAITLLAISFASGLTVAGERPQVLTKPRMTFAKAAEPFLNEDYNKDGYIDSKGKVRNEGLGCSAYTSAVLHRMRDGDAWLSRFDWELYQQYGDVVAKRFGLKSAGKFAAADLLSIDATKRLVGSKKLASGSLYVFNARKKLCRVVDAKRRARERSALLFLAVSGEGNRNGLPDSHSGP